MFLGVYHVFHHREHMSTTWLMQIMEAYCVFLMGNFIALSSFRTDYGIDDGRGGRVIETSWQSALQMGGPLGALMGVFLAGPLTTWLGYRWATIAGLMALVRFLPARADIRMPRSFVCFLPTRSPCSSSRNFLKVSHGVSSSPTRPHTVVRLCQCDFERQRHRFCNCSGPSVRSSSGPSPMSTTRNQAPLLIDCRQLFNGCSPLRSPFSCTSPRNHPGG